MKRDKHQFELANVSVVMGMGTYYTFQCALHGCAKQYGIWKHVLWRTSS